MKPSNFSKVFPYISVLRKTECEILAKNIMIILKRTGDNWRTITWEEYQEEREKDSNFSLTEKHYFDKVLPYTTSETAARSFSDAWKKV